MSDGPYGPPDPAALEETAEAPKAPAKKPLSGAAKRRAAKERAASGKAPASRGGRRPAKKDLSQGLALAWGMAGGALVMGGASPAAGRLMQVQAPMAGRELNVLVKEHPVLYAILSPILGMQELTVASKVFGPPVMVAMLERRPDLLPVFRPLLLPMLYDLYRDLKKYEAREREVMESLAEGQGETFEAEFQEFLNVVLNVREGSPAPSETSSRPPSMADDEGAGDHPVEEEETPPEGLYDSVAGMGRAVDVL